MKNWRMEMSEHDQEFPTKYNHKDKDIMSK